MALLPVYPKAVCMEVVESAEKNLLSHQNILSAFLLKFGSMLLSRPRKFGQNTQYCLKWAASSGFVTRVMSWNYYTLYYFYATWWQTLLFEEAYLIWSLEGECGLPFSHWFLLKVICDAFCGQ